MKLGAFSVSLNVKDIHASKKFYESIGFTEFAGNIERDYLIMKNGDTIIGLFQGMFERNILTFNPGWDQDAQNLDNFQDLREILSVVKSKGISTEQESNIEGEGPASFVMIDPDGNPILFDQHR